MIHKSFDASRVTIKDADAGEFSAVFATLDVIDKDGDVITKGAIADGAKVAISPYGHSVWKGDPPVGVGTIHEEGAELVVKGRYFLDTTRGRDDFNTVKALAADGQGEWSFGLMDVKSEAGDLAGVKANFIKSVRVPEVSPVFMGAGMNTRTTMTKTAKFSEQADTVMAEVDALIDRAEEVVTLRAAKGKTIGADSAELLTKVNEGLGRLKALLEEPIEVPEPPRDEVDRDVLALIAIRQGVTQ